MLIYLVVTENLRTFVVGKEHNATNYQKKHLTYGRSGAC